MEGSKTGYTTWGNVAGGCAHIHGSLEEGVTCLDREQYRVIAIGDESGSDRWLYSLELHPGDEVMRRPLNSKDKAILRRIGF